MDDTKRDKIHQKNLNELTEALNYAEKAATIIRRYAARRREGDSQFRILKADDLQDMATNLEVYISDELIDEESGLEPAPLVYRT